jgi:U3 small nucleolar RNA-associated protein 5
MFPSSEIVIILSTAIDPSIMVQIADDEANEDEAPPPIIYEDKDTDDEESEPDAMETDGEAEELGDVTDASDYSDTSEIMMY